MIADCSVTVDWDGLDGGNVSGYIVDVVDDTEHDEGVVVFAESEFTEFAENFERYGIFDHPKGGFD
jgi:hypothetical protein